MVTNKPPITIDYQGKNASPKSPFVSMPDVKRTRDLVGNGVLVIEQRSEVRLPMDGVEKPQVPFATCFELVNHDSRLTLSDDSYVQLVMGAGLKIKVKQKGVNKQVQKWLNKIKLEEKIEDGLHSLFQCGNLMFEIEEHGAQLVEIDMSTITSVKRTKKGDIQKYLQSVDDFEKPKELDPQEVVHFKLTNVRREVWGRGLYHSLFSPRNIGEDELAPIINEWKIQSDMVKIFDSYASPIMMIHFKDAGEQWIKKYETEFKKMKAGTKVLTDKEFDAKVFEVNGAAKFAEYVGHLQKNVIEPGAQFPLSFFTDGFSSKNAAEVSESMFGRKVKRIQKRVAQQIKDQIVMKYIESITNKGFDPDDVTVQFEIESRSEVGEAELLQMFEKGVITRSEYRTHLSKKTTIELDESDMKNTPPITSTTPTNDMRTSQPSAPAAGTTPSEQQAQLAQLQDQMQEMRTVIETKIPKPRGRPKKVE